MQVLPIAGADPLLDPSFARDLAHRFLVWDAFVGGRRRVDVTPLVLPHALHEAATRAAEEAVRGIGRVTARAHASASERAQYGFDEDTLRLAAASHEAGDDAALMRVDLLLDEHGDWKACEINADCPGGHNESLGLPRLARAAGFLDGQDPTRVVEELVARLRKLADGGAVGVLHATGYSEDLQVCALVARALEREGTRAILAPPTAPKPMAGTSGGELFLHGEPVRVLYRYFPTEWMSGQRNVEAIARAVESRAVRALTSFAHVFTQSKLAFARARACDGTTSGALDGESATSLAKILPETHDVRDLARDLIVANRGDWVVKRALGRVGDQVFVGDLFEDARAWGQCVDEVFARANGGERWIAQRFIRQRSIPTPWGRRLVTLGAYVLDGRFVGYFARLTPRSHVSHDALCVPVFALRAT